MQDFKIQKLYFIWKIKDFKVYFIYKIMSNNKDKF